jgi:hypothetical protein
MSTFETVLPVWIEPIEIPCPPVERHTARNVSASAQVEEDRHGGSSRLTVARVSEELDVGSLVNREAVILV